MCGIAGYFSPGNKVSASELERMGTALAHRGPDAHAVFTEKSVGFAHRRLSVIDLSSNSNQPMRSSNGRYVIVYNGEIYNYLEIANEIRSTMHPRPVNFRSSGDTEIILEAFALWGPEFVQKLNGMFAIVIYDTEKEELFLFRDRMGIKPLYYYLDGNELVFASEVKALRECSSIVFSLNKEAVHYFLHLGFIPAPLTIYKGIAKLPPGCYMRIGKSGSEVKRYWSLYDKIKEEAITDEKTALVKMSELLKSSVQYQLIADVPFGVFLSGGIDSSLVTALAVNLSSVKVNTFSIGFEEDRFNEAGYARTVAGYMGTSHHEFVVSYRDAINLLDEMFESFGEPFADSSAFPTMLVSKLARQYVTVALSGEGGDELFFGYGAYRWAKRLDDPFIRMNRGIIKKILELKGGNRYLRASKMFEFNSKTFLPSHILSQEQYMFSFAEAEAITGNVMPRGLWEDSSGRTPAGRSIDPMEAQSHFDMMFYLPDDLLTKVDRSSMHYSLETRVPYLDHRLVEFALNLSPEMKYRDGISKFILKEILYQYIPERYFKRPKQGFAIPLAKWLGNELSFLIDEFLSDEMISKYKLVDLALTKQLVKEFREGKTFLYNRIWALIVLHRWCVKYQVSV